MNKPLIILALTLTILFSSPATYAESPILSIAETISNYKKGQIIAYFDEDGNSVDQSQSLYYRKYLGTTPKGYYLIQDFYSKSNKKQNNPIAIKSKNDLYAWTLTTAEGKSVTWYEDGKKRTESYRKNGKREGFATQWHNNGQKHLNGYFKEGIPEGLVTEWYEDGQKHFETFFKKNKAGDLWIEWNKWHENGEKWQEGFYKNGEEEGLWTTWNKSGQKQLEGHFKNGKPVGIWTIWDEEGNKQPVDTKTIKETYFGK